MSLIQKAKLNGHDPHAYSKDILQRWRRKGMRNRQGAASPLVGCGTILRAVPLTNGGDALIADLLHSPSMSGSFFFRQHTVFVSNRRLTTLVEFVLSTANDQAITEEARAFVGRFETLQADTFFPGIDIDLEELFPSSSERRFWASAFAELAKRIEQRRIGNPDQHDWRGQAADQAAQIAQMLLSNREDG